jgi:thiamine biosynthesis lipoprotein
MRLLPLITVSALLSCGPPPPKKPAALSTPSSAAEGASSGAVVPATSSAAAPFEVKRVTLERGAMGTKIVMASFTTPTLDADTIGRAMGEAYDEIKRLENLMSTWVETSEVTAINRGGGGPPVTVGPDTFAVIERSVAIASQSEGVFDITFEAMKGVWRFDEGAQPNVPSDADVQRTRRLVDWRMIELDPNARTVRLKEKDRKINLGGIAKGYAVDAAARVLERRGVTSFFVQAGGDLYVKGRRYDGRPFRVGVRDPRGKDEQDFFALMEVEDHAFSTAGDYERAFVRDGKRYHHIIDPRTGYPATACRSVTVWAKDAFTADALDDAVFILGPEKGLQLIEATEGVGAVIVDAKNEVWVSKRLKDLVTQLRPPTEGP